MTRTIIIAEDHPDVRTGLQIGLDRHPDLAVVEVVDTADEAVARVSVTQPDVIILDQRMPGMTGIEAIPHLKRVASRTRVVMLTADAAIGARALAAGADAVVQKGPPGLLQTLVDECRGETATTER